jgi:hypothetical protein
MECLVSPKSSPRKQRKMHEHNFEFGTASYNSPVKQ